MLGAQLMIILDRSIIRANIMLRNNMLVTALTEVLPGSRPKRQWHSLEWVPASGGRFLDLA
jgi:hypothetical protein